MSEEQLELKEENPVEELDTDEQAARIFNLAHKNFKKLTYPLAERKRKALGRVLEAVLFEPLEAVELHGVEEKRLFDLCKEILYNKGIIIQFALKQKEKEQGEQNEQK